MGVPNLRAIRDWCRESFLSKEEMLNTEDDVKSNEEPGKPVDALVIKEVFQSVSNGKELLASAITDKGIKADAGDTFAEMADKITRIESSEGSGGSNEVISSPYSFTVSASGAFLSTRATTIDQYFPVKYVKRMVLKSLYLYITRTLTTYPDKTLYFYIYGKNSNQSTAIIKSYSVSLGTSSTKSEKEVEIDLSGFESIEYIRISTSNGSGTVYTYTYQVLAEIELYF